MYSSVRDALMKLCKSSNTWHISHAYRGILPAALGAIPSSALYFGAYESSKLALSQWLLNDDTQKQSTFTRRFAVHGSAAACGNMLSSAVFVPKEVIKQQLQYQAAAASAAAAAAQSTTATAATTMGGVVVKVLQEKGIRGLYSGYQATLMRNIPSAMIRFVLYEELKRWWGYPNNNNSNNNNNNGVERRRTNTNNPNTTNDRRRRRRHNKKVLPLGLFAAGAIAGAVSSGLMTPVDVLKTRMATGTCPVGSTAKSCMVHIAKESGWQGLYAGAGSRMMWSGAFSAIGFGTFESVKGMLGVAESSGGDDDNHDDDHVAPRRHYKATTK
jgi:solute carrier family 25 S-adenosylmethionine transporter 26